MSERSSDQGGLEPAEPAFAAIFPDTHYFEIDSRRAKARYAVWVTLPPGAANSGARLPAVFMPDGNWLAPILTPMSAMAASDPINPVQPVIQVAIGYAGADAADIMRIRNRDLLPPGERPNPHHLAAFDHGVDQGLYDKDWADGFKHLMNNGRGDAFLEFLAEELFPQIVDRYPVSAEDCGFFGYSYGGLFATYLALKRLPAFTRVGAGSPGFMTPESVPLQLWAEHSAAGTIFAGHHLHMTVCERELTVATPYQMLAQGFSRFVTRQGLEPLPGLQFTSAVLPFESHASGLWPSWFSFLRTCYGSAAS
ncbi:alpha/beta hydrolase [Tsuneonella rigui]|uniref:alpha/beta hydrolase n=1 Tax=Tsuneonella rigui TaxID=1708790 RepID=UPI000F7F734A|nr:alpha/beta hydrolase-fold protein [Tsuneonella rigui]